jgi:hypothetical protein
MEVMGVNFPMVLGLGVVDIRFYKRGIVMLITCQDQEYRFDLRIQCDYQDKGQRSLVKM